MKFSPGAKPTKPKIPQGSSHKTLTVKVKPHTRRAPAPKVNPLDMPITPGSSITVRQARRMAANANTVRYGGQETGLNQQLASSQQLGADQAGWYRQYLTQLAQYQQDAENQAKATNTAMQQQADSLRSLDQSNLNAQQQQMNADAAARGATASPQTSTDASNASLVRQALEGSLGALLAARGGAAVTQASNLAHVVGPIQQGQAQAQNAKQQQALREQLTGLKGQEGAYQQQFIDSLTGQEAKNILAASIASGKDLASVKIAKVKAGASAQTARVKANAQGQKVNSYGYTNKQWSQMTPAQRQQIMAKVKAQGRAPGSAKAGPKPPAGPGSLTPSAEAKIISNIHQVVAMIQRAPKTDSKGVPLTDHELRTRLASTNNPFKKVIDPRIVNIAFDLARNGGLSTPNVKAAHDLGIHVNGHFKVLKKQRLTATQQKTANSVFQVPQGSVFKP